MNDNKYYDDVKIKNVGFKKRPQKNTSFINKNDTPFFKDVQFKKSLGQNFIADKNLLNFIVKSAEVSSCDCVLEIGAGAGTLTEVLAENAKEVISFEIDKTLKDKLQDLEQKYNNLIFMYEDFMKSDVNKIFTECEKFKVVANIPYYITTPIIFKLLEDSARISSMIFMVQKEVAERFSASEGNKSYGVTSVILQSIADVKYLRTIKKECFFPAPKVDSALIKIVFKTDNKPDFDFEKFREFIHNSFAMRRKTLINNLIKKYEFDKETITNSLLKINHNENTRPEDISVNKFINLFKYLFN